MASAQRKRIAIAGGGFAGLGSLIMLKEEGLEPFCFERTDKLGGTWNYREESIAGVPSVMPTTITIHSKEFGALSNYPPPKELPNYMKHSQLLEFFMGFVTKNDALKHIQFNSEVVEVKRAPDYEETGRWIMSVKNTLTGEVTLDTYDGVVICTGHINVPKWPGLYPDQNKFRGKIIHSHYVKGVTPYTNKNVVVVGMGCSGIDAAVEISSVAKQVYLSSRSGAYVLNRVGPSGLPSDYILLRRYLLAFFNLLPFHYMSWLVESIMCDSKFNSNLYAVKPQFHVLSKDPVFGDLLPAKLISGTVIQKKDISKFTENGLIFEDESTVTEADIVIMATGYTHEFPFLEKDIRIELEKELNLYKCTFPPKLKHSTMAFGGLLLPWGAGFSVGELQCRLIAQVFAGNVKLPSNEEMLNDVLKRVQTNNRRYGPSSKQGIRVDYIQFQDEIAELIGCKPNFFKMLFTDPQLWYKLIFSASVPYQYRLQGPHPWEGAREAIMTSDERVLYPLKRKQAQRMESLFLHYLKKFLYFLLPLA